MIATVAAQAASFRRRGVGGYASGPVVSRRCRIPTVVRWNRTGSGVTNRILSHVVWRMSLLSFPHASRYFLCKAVELFIILSVTIDHQRASVTEPSDLLVRFDSGARWFALVPRPSPRCSPTTLAAPAAVRRSPCRRFRSTCTFIIRLGLSDLSAYPAAARCSSLQRLYQRCPSSCSSAIWPVPIATVTDDCRASDDDCRADCAGRLAVLDSVSVCRRRSSDAQRALPGRARSARMLPAERHHA